MVNKTKLIKYISFVIIGIIPAIGIIINFVMDFNRDKKQTELSYLTLALANKPYIIIDRPDTLGITLKYSNQDVVDSLFFSKHKTPSIRMDMTYDLKLKLKNVGNSTAKLFAIIFAQYPNSTDTLRYILNGVLRNRSSTNKLISELEPDLEIMPQDSLIDTFPMKIEPSSDSVFIQHLLLLYCNDAGTVFDTYCRLIFSLNEIMLETEIDTTSNGIKVKRTIIGTPISFKRIVNSSNVYDKNQSEMIINLIND